MSRKFIQFVFIVALIGCEKVIDIPLREAEQAIVVEGIGRSFPGETYVLLSKTSSSSDNSEGFERLSGAQVKIQDSMGNIFLLEEDADVKGRYQHPTFVVLANLNYNLTIDYQGESLSASSRALTVPQIDSLEAFLVPGGFGAEPEDSNYVLTYTVSDNVLERNYYRFVVWVNGVRDLTYFIETDDLGNGETYTAPFFGLSVDSKDTVYTELWSMDKANYAYFSGVFNVLNQSPFSAAPGNPPSNVENGIGHFGAFMIDTMSIIIP